MFASYTKDMIIILFRMNWMNWNNLDRSETKYRCNYYIDQLILRCMMGIENPICYIFCNIYYYST